MAGTVVSTQDLDTISYRNNVRIYTLSCTADAADGSVPATATPPINGYVFRIVTTPGSSLTTPGTAITPTALFDLTITDTRGIDIAKGNLANRSATVSEDISLDTYVNGGLTLNTSNNSVNSARFFVEIYVHD